MCAYVLRERLKSANAVYLYMCVNEWKYRYWFLFFFFFFFSGLPFSYFCVILSTGIDSIGISLKAYFPSEYYYKRHSSQYYFFSVHSIHCSFFLTKSYTAFYDSIHVKFCYTSFFVTIFHYSNNASPLLYILSYLIKPNQMSRVKQWVIILVRKWGKEYQPLHQSSL